MSYDATDIINMNLNNVQGGPVLRKQGDKAGRARGIFSATGGLATGPYSLVGLDGVALAIPPGSTITRVVYKVLTSFESGTDAATIALSCVAANDIKSALALSDGSNIWDAATLPVVCIPVTATLSTWLTVPTTGPLPIVATVGVEALTSGKLVVWVEWNYWGNIPLT